MLCLTLIGVTVGMVYMTWKGGVRALRVQDVLAGVAGVYWLIVFCVLAVTP